MTTALAYKTSQVPKIKMATITTPRIAFITACTPQVVNLAKQEGYTDAQFYADLKKASKKLDAMAAEALQDEAEGKTREFPV